MLTAWSSKNNSRWIEVLGKLPPPRTNQDWIKGHGNDHLQFKPSLPSCERRSPEEAEKLQSFIKCQRNSPTFKVATGASQPSAYLLEYQPDEWIPVYFYQRKPRKYKDKTSSRDRSVFTNISLVVSSVVEKSGPVEESAPPTENTIVYAPRESHLHNWPLEERRKREKEIDSCSFIPSIFYIKK